MNSSMEELHDYARLMANNLQTHLRADKVLLYHARMGCCRSPWPKLLLPDECHTDDIPMSSNECFLLMCPQFRAASISDTQVTASGEQSDVPTREMRTFLPNHFAHVGESEFSPHFDNLVFFDASL